MNTTTCETRTSEPVICDYDAAGKGLDEWVTQMHVEAKQARNVKDGTQRSLWSRVTGSAPTKVDKVLAETLARYWESLGVLANPDRSPAEYAESFVKAEEAEKTLCATEGYGDFDHNDKGWLNNAKQSIMFGVVSRLCASEEYGPGIPISHGAETVNLVNKFFDVESKVSGVCQSYSSACP